MAQDSLELFTPLLETDLDEPRKGFGAGRLFPAGSGSKATTAESTRGGGEKAAGPMTKPFRGETKLCIQTVSAP